MDTAIPIINNTTSSSSSLKGHHQDRHHHRGRLPCFRRTTNSLSCKIQFLKPLLIFVLFPALLLSILIVSAFGIGSLILHHSTADSTPSVLTLDQTMEMVSLVCNATHYPSSCLHSLAQEIAGPAVDSPARNYVDGIFKVSLTVAARELQNMSGSIPAVAVNLKVNRRRDERVKAEGALKDCRGLIEDAIDKIETAMTSIEEKEEEYKREDQKQRLFLVSEDKKMVSDVKTWVSAALTNTDTCLDGLEDVMDDNDDDDKIIPEEMKIGMMNAKEYVTNCLGIVSNFEKINRLVRWHLHRRR